MTKKENYIIAMEHKIPESVPYYGVPVRFSTGFTDVFEKGPKGGGYDGYGVRWEGTEGGNVPATDVFLLTDPVKWESLVRFPDLDSIDWEMKSKAELSGFDPDTQVLEYGMGNGPFERLLALCGYQNLIDFLLDEPEAVKDFLAAWTEHRYHFIDIVSKYYHPDYINIYDDVAFEGGLFLTKDMYEEFIQPVHKKVNKYMRSKGIIPVNHCCGLAQDLIENFIDEDCQAWTSCQPINDIAMLLEKYHDKITIIGGYDSNGAPSLESATKEMRMEEAYRVIDSYAKWGSFIFGNMLFMTSDPIVRKERTEEVLNEVVYSYGDHWYKKNGLI